MVNELDDLIPSPKEALFAIIFAGFIPALIIAGADLQIHDNFILPLHDCGHLENELCDRFWMEQDCDPNGETSCLGQNFWIVLPTIILLFAIGVGIARVFFGWYGGASFNGMLILIGLLWFLTAYILPFTGWGDAIYFWLQGEDVPDRLPWLNGIGVLMVFNLGDEPNTVEKEDLYFIMGLGLGGIIGMWAFVTHLHNRDVLEFLK